MINSRMKMDLKSTVVHETTHNKPTYDQRNLRYHLQVFVHVVATTSNNFCLEFS